MGQCNLVVKALVNGSYNPGYYHLSWFAYDSRFWILDTRFKSELSDTRYRESSIEYHDSIDTISQHPETSRQRSRQLDNGARLAHIGSFTVPVE